MLLTLALVVAPAYALAPQTSEPVQHFTSQFVVAYQTNVPPVPAISKETVAPQDHQEVVAYIKEVFGEKASQAIRIFTCESGLRPEAYNPELYAKAHGITKYGSYGVAQLNRPEDPRLFDYHYNIDEAYQLYLRRGFYPWSCYSKLSPVVPGSKATGV